MTRKQLIEKYKRTLYCHKTLRENVEYFYSLATDTERRQGESWYHRAYEFCESLADETGIPIGVIAAVVSALSPGNAWDQNKADAITLIKAHAAGLGPANVNVCTYKRQKRKAWEILDTWDVSLQGSGLKTNAFQHCILCPGGRAVPPELAIYNDRHVLGVAVRSTGEYHKALRLTKRRYRNVAAAVAELSQDMGYVACQLQAIVWLVYRNRFVS